MQRIPESLAQVSFSSCVKFLDLSSWHCQTEGKSHLCVGFFFPFVLRPRACGQCSVKRLLLGRASGCSMDVLEVQDKTWFQQVSRQAVVEGLTMLHFSGVSLQEVQEF